MQIRRSGKSRCTEKLPWLLLQRTSTGGSGGCQGRMEMWTQVGLGIPPQTRPTWFPLKKPKEKKKQGTPGSALEIRTGAAGLPQTWSFCWRWEGQGWGTVIGKRNNTAETGTPRGHILLPLPHPQGQWRALMPTPEKNQLGWTLPTLHRADTCAGQRAVCWPQDKEAAKSFEPLC